MNTKGLIFLIPFALLFLVSEGQNAKTHHIPAAPWKYWSDANELVVTTNNINPVSVTVMKSDLTRLTSFQVSFNNPRVYRFSGSPGLTVRNELHKVLNGEGLIVESSANIQVNLRNVASDQIHYTLDSVIKGNASLVSFGNQGLGVRYRLGYYRRDTAGLHFGSPVYSVMATQDRTGISVDGRSLVELQKGQCYLFFAPFGSLLTATAPVTVVSSTMIDKPGGCGDGVFDQLPPLSVLGSRYLIVRGAGSRGFRGSFPEQTSIIAHHDGTVVNIRNFNAIGNELFPSPATILLNSGQSHTFHQGDGLNPYSTSYITSNRNITVLYGTGDTCEVDMSAVPSLSSCSGSDTIQTTRFTDYFNNPLPYFGFVIIDHPTEVVTINGVNLETRAGSRIPIGNTGYYMIRFNHVQLGNPANIIMLTRRKVTVSFIQQGRGFSMSSYFSLFSDIPALPDTVSDPCGRKRLLAEAGLGPYQWFRNDTLLVGETDRALSATSPGIYTYTGTRTCGVTAQSSPLVVDAPRQVIKETRLSATICEGESYRGYSSSGTYREVFSINNGCGDSIILVSLQVNPRPLFTETAKICEGRALYGYTKSGSYKDTFKTAFGCDSIRILNLTVQKWDVSRTDVVRCEGDKFTLPGGRIVSTTGIYIDTTRTTTGCDSLLRYFSIQFESYPKMLVSKSNDVNCNKGMAELSASGGKHFRWTDERGNVLGGDRTITVAPKIKTSYTVESWNVEGCATRQAVTVYVDTSGAANSFLVPTAFTPNGDGLNDCFNVRYWGPVDEFRMDVYDRWGELIFSSNDIQACWSGTLKRRPMPSGAYPFVIRGTGVCGPILRMGLVNLIR
jgi:gliding motility-associated-like protein